MRRLWSNTYLGAGDAGVPFSAYRESAARGAWPGSLVATSRDMNKWQII